MDEGRVVGTLDDGENVTKVGEVDDGEVDDGEVDDGEVDDGADLEFSKVVSVK